MVKTNAMRMLDAAGISYEIKSYAVDEDDLSGVHAAEMMGLDADMVFKTLVARDERNGLHVFCIPVAAELDLKKCAQVVGCKRIEMIHVREMPTLTGYIRGGCSPVGMKKRYPTVLDETAVLYDRIYVSAGQRGLQMCVSPEALRIFLEAEIADLTQA